METSFKNFMTGLIDYAGSFPPASLDIETAVDNFSRYLKGEKSWMIGRCILPATQLHRVILPPESRSSVIVSSGISEQELDQLLTFKGPVEMIETRFPENTDSPEHFSDYLLHIRSGLHKAGLHAVRLFVEAENIVPAIQAIAAFNRSLRIDSNGDLSSKAKVIDDIGFKLRCGGIIRDSIPSADKVAEVITLCRQHDLAIKFTAGMHHPFHSHSHKLQAIQHGFLNVVGAALLSWSEKLSYNELRECIGDETADNFHFSKEHFSWKNNKVVAEEITRLRQSRVISFGSCSFTEPVEGLGSLGFLNNVGG